MAAGKGGAPFRRRDQAKRLADLSRGANFGKGFEEVFKERE